MIKGKPSPILICVAAIALNLCGAFVARSFELPLFLDTVGTIFIAMMSGYVPGVVVGFTTHFLTSFVDEEEMYYCSVSIFIAIATTFLARRGWFRKFFKALAVIPALAIIATILSEVIGKFLFCTGVVQALSEIQMHFAINFLLELADKGLSITAAFLLVKFVPASIKDTFSIFGKRQAPLTAELRSAVYERKCPKSSLRTRILLILMLSSLFIAASIASISYRIFEQAATNVQIKIADGLATIAANQIDLDNLADVDKKFAAIKDSNSDVKNLRVEKFLPDNVTAGAATISDTSLTLYKPIRDRAGEIQCYVAIELSMDLISVFVFVIGLRFVENNIVLPVNTMDYCTRNFVYDSEEFCAQSLDKLKRLKIHTGDEIENLYHALLKTMQDAIDYFEKLRQAKRQVAEMNELAYKDSLTGLKNKAAYDETTAKLDKKISYGDAQFCIVMVDVNFLKRVNDTYGHERGNNYLVNAAKLICSVFGEEHVYRIGGDEFVVVIEGEKVSLCKYFVEQFRAEMARKNANNLLEPWEKISAAAGISFYKAGVDKSVDEVFKLADKEMYANKLAMKATRTD